MDFFSKCYQGNEELWKTFWVGAVGGGVLLLGAINAIEWLIRGTMAWVVLFYIWWIFPLVFAIWALVSIWRCAPNSQWKGWFYGARAFVVGAAIWVLSWFVRF